MVIDLTIDNHLGVNVTSWPCSWTSLDEGAIYCRAVWIRLYQFYLGASWLPLWLHQLEHLYILNTTLVVWSRDSTECILTMRLHTAPCLLCMSGVRRTCSVVTMASPISSQWEEPKDPTPRCTDSTIIVSKPDTAQWSSMESKGHTDQNKTPASEMWTKHSSKGL